MHESYTHAGPTGAQFSEMTARNVRLAMSNMHTYGMMCSFEHDTASYTRT